MLFARTSRLGIPMKLSPALSALQSRDFRVYWIGQAISLVGTWMQFMAQSWVVTELSASAAVVAWLNVVASLPVLLLSLKAGALADRLEKRRILILTQLGFMLCAFALAGLVYSGHLALWNVFLTSTILGIVTAFDLPASQALPPELVAPRDIPNAVALMQPIFHGARLIGPALAGALIAAFGNGSAFIVNGLSFLAVLYSLAVITPRPPLAQATKKPGAGGVGEGIAYVRSEPAVLSLIILTGLVTALVFPFLIVHIAQFVRRDLGAGDASAVGYVMSASGLGSLVGALAIIGGSPKTRRLWLIGGALGASAGLFGLALSGSVLYAVPLVSVMSFSISSLMGRVAQMIQERVPNQLRGRVMGIFSLSFTGVMPFAGLLLGFLADAVSYSRLMEVCAVLFAASALFIIFRAGEGLSAPAAVPEARPASS